MRNVLGELITGDDDLLPPFVEGVKGMEEFGLRSFFPRDELDIIDEQDIHPPKFISKLVHLFVTEGIDELVRKLFRREVADLLDLGKNPVHENMVPDGMEEVRLPQSDASVDEKGIIILGRLIGHRQASGIGKLITGSHDKIVKGILRGEDRLNGPSHWNLSNRLRLLSISLLISNPELEVIRHVRQLR